MKKAGTKIIIVFLKLMFFILLSPRSRASVGNLDQKEVDDVYRREAKTYRKKHHLTTRGQDTAWRRWVGWAIASMANNRDGIKILDLCTGTGMGIEEMMPVLRKRAVKAEIIGLDYNLQMLEIARSSVIAENGFSVDFVRGDAADLSSTLGTNTFDFVTQMCGIGGIPQPQKVFEEVLRVLKEGGRFVMVDIHKPLPEFPCEWPLFFNTWLKSEFLEAEVYNKFTLPIALARLWGWRDPTPAFKSLPFTVIEDEGGRWGFKTQWFEVVTERWWFGLPFMPTAKIIVEKIKI